jgi:hypothetical protein
MNIFTCTEKTSLLMMSGMDQEKQTPKIPESAENHEKSK